MVTNSFCKHSKTLIIYRTEKKNIHISGEGSNQTKPVLTLQKSTIFTRTPSI